MVELTEKKAKGGLPVWIKTARPFTLSATMSPILVGSALAVYESSYRAVGPGWSFSLLWFVITLASCLCLQIGTNYFNEYFDYRYGLDHAESLGASTVIFRGEMTAKQVLGGGIGCFVVAALLGIILAIGRGPNILLFGLAGMLVAYFYSAKPFKLASRGLGDVLVFLVMGVLMTWGAYYVLWLDWSWPAIAASVPVGFLVTAIMNMNNVRDYQDDLAVAKKTLPVRFGLRFGKIFHVSLLAGSYLTLTIFTISGLLPWWCLLVWLSVPLAVRNSMNVIKAAIGERKAYMIGIKDTARLLLIFSVLLAFTLVLAYMVNTVRF